MLIATNHASDSCWLRALCLLPAFGALHLGLPLPLESARLRQVLHPREQQVRFPVPIRGRLLAARRAGRRGWLCSPRALLLAILVRHLPLPGTRLARPGTLVLTNFGYQRERRTPIHTAAIISKILSPRLESKSSPRPPVRVLPTPEVPVVTTGSTLAALSGERPFSVMIHLRDRRTDVERPRLTRLTCGVRPLGNRAMRSV